MRVPQRLDYAVRALTALAMLEPGVTIAAGELADTLNLPRRFVEQQITVLVRSGLVSSRRGPKGGCALARPPADITVHDVIVAVQGDILDVPHVSKSAVSEMWAAAADALAGSFKGVTVADLAERQRDLNEDVGVMYHI